MIRWLLTVIGVGALTGALAVAIFITALAYGLR